MGLLVGAQEAAWLSGSGRWSGNPEVQGSNPPSLPIAEFVLGGSEFNFSFTLRK